MNVKFKIGLFISNKKSLNHIFFAKTEPKYRFTTSEEETFWTFIEKIKHNPKYEQLFEEEKRIQLRAKYTKEYESIISPTWMDDEALRRDKSRLRFDMKTDEILQFRDLLLVYIDFREKKNIKAREKLYAFQRNLPIYEKKKDISDVLEKHPVVLIAGDTGCGKSTQVPQYLLEAGYENIACTQPRRLACITLRNRLAYETNNQFGTEVGYQIRFEKKKSQKTKILFLTEGLLLRQMIEDPEMKAYDVIIMDEIHERHLSCDFLLGAIKCLLYRRQGQLKVILMSATVNWKMFAQYFSCFVIQVPGRLYPIDTQYFPISKLQSDNSRIDCEPYLKMLRYIDDKFPSNQRGDALVFLSGAMEIETIGETLKLYAEESKKWIILYLHSQLPFDEQDKVFDIAPEGVRKCVLSTNIAETSLTIDGIRFVVDSGKVKEMHYEVQDRTQKLQEVWVSKASADQRKGRAGRTGPGLCFRLYSNKQFEEFDDYPTPEIKRTSLEPLLLNMISMGVQDVRQFPFIEGPSLEKIDNTIKSLVEYETLEEDESITVLGRILSRLPVDISIGKLLVFSVAFDLVDYFLSVCACLSVQTIFTSKSQNNLELSEQRKEYISYDGDFFFQIRLYTEWLRIRERNQNSQRWCRKLGVEEQRFFEITKLRNQFRDILADTGLLEDQSGRNQTKDDGRTLSKQERMLKNQDRKLYGKLKRELEQAGGSSSRKTLKLEHEITLTNTEDGEQDDELDQYSSMKSVEFKLLFDSHRLNAIHSRHSLSHSEKRIAKLIVAASFSPQFALFEELASYRSDGDRTLRTRDRASVVIHPSSVFYNDPDMLKSIQTEQSSLGVLSAEHKVVGYTSLLETSKHYICNLYSIPAAHCLLFCAKQIDVDGEFDRVICDQWIQLTFLDPAQCRKLLLKTHQLRHKLNQLLLKLFLTIKFDGNLSVEEQLKIQSEKLSKQELSDFINDLQESAKNFFELKPKYSIKFLTSYQVKKLYNKVQMNSDRFEMLKKFYIIEYLCENNVPLFDSVNGGVRFGIFTFDCLNPQESLSLIRTERKEFVCEFCSETMNLTAIERARHEDDCRMKANQALQTAETTATSNQTTTLCLSDSHSKSNSSTYFCQTCRQEFAFSKIEILRHRQLHSENVNVST